MGIVVSAVASGLVQNIQKDFIKEEDEKKFVRWKEEQLVEVKDEVEEDDDRRVEIPGFPPVTLDIPSLHREGGKQGRVSRSSQQSQTDSPQLESILRSRELSNGEQGQSQPVEDQQLAKSTRENSTSTSLFQDFFSSLGRRSPKSSEKEKEGIEDVDRQNGDTAIKDETLDSNANQSQTNSELIDKDNEINRALLEGHHAQPKAINESPAKTRRPTFDETPLASPSRRSRLGSGDGVHFGIMPIVNLLPKLTDEISSEQLRPRSAWFRSGYTNLETVQKIYLTHPKPVTSSDKGRRRRRSQSSSVMSSPVRRHTHLRCEAGCLRGGPRDNTDPSLQRRSSDTPSSLIPQCPKTPHKKRFGGSLASSPVRRARAGVAETLVKEAGSMRGSIRETLVRDAGHSFGEVRETLHAPFVRRASDTPTPTPRQVPKTPRKKRLGSSLVSSPVRRRGQL